MALKQTLLRSKASTICSCPRPFTTARVVVPSSRPAHVSAPRSFLNVTCQASAAAAPVEEKKYHPSPLSQAAPSTYAVIEVAGKQMFVEPNKWYTCNRLQASVGSKIKFGRVLAVKNNGKLTVGQPYLENVTVEADILEELRGPKIVVYKMRPKKHYRRKQGHRQDLTKFMVTSIVA